MKRLLFLLLFIPVLAFGQKAVIYSGKAFTYGGKVLTDNYWANLMIVFSKYPNDITQTLMHSNGDKRVIIEGDYIKYSADNGDTYNAGVDITAFYPVGEVAEIRILNNGIIVVFSHKTSLHYSDDNLVSLIACTVLDAAGAPYSYHIPVNANYPGGYWNFMGGFIEHEGVSVLGNYTNSSHGASPINLYYTLDGITWKVFYTFGQSPNHTDDGTASGGVGGNLLGDATNPLLTRHIHSVNIGSDGNFYAGMGDGSGYPGEMHFMRCTYDSGTDTWIVVDLLDANSRRWPRMRVLGVYEYNGYLYWASDGSGTFVYGGITYNSLGIYKSLIADINDASKHILLQKTTDVFYSFLNVGRYVLGGLMSDQNIYLSADHGDTWKSLNKPSNFGGSVDGVWYNDLHNYFGCTKKILMEIKNGPRPDGAPFDLLVDSFSETTVTLSATEGSTNEDGYLWERSDDGGGTWNEIGTTASGDLTYTDTGLTPFATCQYRVCAYVGIAFSAYSNIVTAIPAINLSFATTGDGTGVFTLTLRSTINTIVTLDGTGRFYTDAGGTLNESTTWTVITGANRTIYIRCTATSHMRLAANTISRLEWGFAANGPYIYGDLSQLTALTYIYSANDNGFSGDISTLALTKLRLVGPNTVSLNLTTMSANLTYIVTNARLNTYTTGGNWSNLLAPTNGYLSLTPPIGYGLNETAVDLLIQEIAATKVPGRVLIISITGSCDPRSSASDIAVGIIEGDGGSVTTNH